jgi:predicted secreted hydrolase
MPRLSRGSVRSLVRLLALLALLVVVPRGVGAETASPVASPSTADAPIPVTFPRDDGPHDASTEWWYYTGHLFTAAGDRYGFEYVVFKGQRGALTGYAAHFAVTDNPRDRFTYGQRLVPATGVSRPAVGFDLTIGDWTMRGANGRDALRAAMPGYGIDLRLESEKPPALHDGDGYIAYGDGTASYYYSRTRLAVEGTLTVDGAAGPVTGEAWMDHQWGDFETYEEGGWDWYALQLQDGTELMLYVIHDPAGRPVIVDGSLIDEDGDLTVLDADDFSLEATDRWTSPRNGTTYPSGWEIDVPAEDLALTVTPTQVDQELDTSRTTGVTYWEGEVTVEGTRDGEPLAGLGYVELTGYAPNEELGRP